METYVLHVPDRTDKITMVDTFHCLERRSAKFGYKRMYFTSNADAEETIQEIAKHVDPTFDRSKSAITSRNEGDPKECIRYFSEKEDSCIGFCYFVWALDDEIPPRPSGKFAMIQMDLVSDKLYRERVEKLNPTIVYNVCASSKEAEAWMNLTKQLGYEASFMDFSTEEKWEEYVNDQYVPY